ncbi:endonuclease domain-containing protein [Sphingomonas changbaiensis]|nr:DUF559 domain-containing protein [Sphingomonas changbaiensis]
MQNYRGLPGGSVDRARELRRNRTEAEDKLWYGLRERLPAYKWRFQVPFHPYYADFACLKAKLIIEVDGGQHDEARARDARRTRFLEAKGFRALRFWNNDVLENLDGVLEAISISLSQRERVSGRSCSQHDLNGVGHHLPDTGAAKPRKGEGGSL